MLVGAPGAGKGLIVSSVERMLTGLIRQRPGTQAIRDRLLITEHFNHQEFAKTDLATGKRGII